jgi:hypothetical protein
MPSKHLAVVSINDEVETGTASLHEATNEVAARIRKWADRSDRHTKTLTFIVVFEADHLSRWVRADSPFAHNRDAG